MDIAIRVKFGNQLEEISPKPSDHKHLLAFRQSGERPVLLSGVPPQPVPEIEFEQSRFWTACSSPSQTITCFTDQRLRALPDMRRKELVVESRSMNTIRFQIAKFDAADAADLEQVLEAVPRVSGVEIDSSGHEAIIQHDGADLTELKRAAQRVGYTAVLT